MTFVSAPIIDDFEHIPRQCPYCQYCRFNSSDELAEHIWRDHDKTGRWELVKTLAEQIELIDTKYEIEKLTDKKADTISGVFGTCSKCNIHNVMLNGPDDLCNWCDARRNLMDKMDHKL